MTRYLKPKTPPPLRDLKIFWDSNEKKGRWELPLPFKMERKRLETGDYTIEGYENLIAIERKSGLLEVFGNLAGSDRVRFENTLLRMSKFPFKAIVIEDEYSNLTRALAILKKKSHGKARVDQASMDCWLNKISIQYGIPVHFIGPHHDGKFLVWMFKIAYLQAFNYKGGRCGKA